MADIELVIKIPEEIYKVSQIVDVKYEDTVQIPLEVIAKGTPLPKRHGSLIDADELLKDRHRAIPVINVIEAPTIIEADIERNDKYGDV